MKGREGKGPPAADLLVCFPSRAHLSLMPKPICSPARPSESSTLHHHHRHHRRPSHHNHLRKSSNRGGGAAGHASPLLWAQTRNNSADISEPTSPKVTCAGQIKVRTKPNSCKNWQSVMEEIERLHNNRKNKKRPAWIEAFGFKKDVMQFLTCLRSIRFDFRCFGAIPSSEVTSDDEGDDEDDDEDANNYRENSRVSKDDIGDDQGSRAVFSKWFMILQEDNVNKELIKAEGSGKRKVIRPYCDEEMVDDDGDGSCQQPPPPPPPPNALLLMRCRSAPAKSWLEEREAERERRSESEREEEVKKTDFSEFSGEIGKEILVTGGLQDKISRSRSCKR